MFPIPWNKEYRKKDGTLVKISDAMGGGGGGSDLPPHSSTDAGKVLTVGEDGNLEWDIRGSGGGFYSGKIHPVFLPISGKSTYRLGCTSYPLDATDMYTSFVTPDTPYTLSDLVDFNIYDVLELFGNVSDDAITELGLVELANTASVTNIEFDTPVTDFDAIVLNGEYDSSGTSSYNTTLLYANVRLNTPYYFGMKDRNPNYGGTITFTSATTAVLSASRRIRIFGLNL